MMIDGFAPSSEPRKDTSDETACRPGHGRDRPGEATTDTAGLAGDC